MADEKEYTLVLRRPMLQPAFKTGEEKHKVTRKGLVKWIAKTEPSRIKKITLNNKTVQGRTVLVDIETLLELGKEVEIEKRKLTAASR
jgi:hypothetical protein